jgi:DUF4097 and DUF4098 domain-containing protein YvlB
VASNVTAKDTVDLSLATTSTQVEVDMFNGSIEVRPGPDGTVTAAVTRTGVGPNHDAALDDAKKIEATLTEQEGAVVLKATYTPNPSAPDQRGAAAVVTVPASSVLVLHTSNGPITLTGLTGTVLADTSNAGVTEKGAMQAVRARTSNGPIAIDGGTGLITVATSNASVDVKATDAVVQAESSNGAVSFAGSLASGASRMATSNAAITVTLPKDAAFTVDAQTSNSKITSDFALAGGSQTQDRVTGTAGTGGGTTLILVTSNGDVHMVAAP